MEREKQTIDESVAYMIRKLADLLWIIPLSLIPALFLTISGYDSFVAVLDIYRRIIANTLWFFFFWKVANLINDQKTTNPSKVNK